jgi:hypothetical protein
MAVFRLKRPVIQENSVEDGCLSVLRHRGYWPIRLHVGRFRTLYGGWITMGDVGTPDWAAIHPRHRGLLLEVKRPGGELSIAQVRKIDQLRLGYGLPVAVVDSAADLSTWLDRHEGRCGGSEAGSDKAYRHEGGRAGDTHSSAQPLTNRIGRAPP